MNESLHEHNPQPAPGESPLFRRALGCMTSGAVLTLTGLFVTYASSIKVNEQDALELIVNDTLASGADALGTATMLGGFALMYKGVRMLKRDKDSYPATRQ